MRRRQRGPSLQPRQGPGVAQAPRDAGPPHRRVRAGARPGARRRHHPRRGPREHAAPRRDGHRGDDQGRAEPAPRRGRLAGLPQGAPRALAAPDQARHADGRRGQEVRDALLQRRGPRATGARSPQGDPRPLRPLPRVRLRAQERPLGQLQHRGRAGRHEPVLHASTASRAASTISSPLPRRRRRRPIAASGTRIPTTATTATTTSASRGGTRAPASSGPSSRTDRAATTSSC